MGIAWAWYVTSYGNAGNKGMATAYGYRMAGDGFHALPQGFRYKNFLL
ncbi:MAG: hypothetical protein ACXAHE_00070 [Roseburia sp. 1XD42-69]